MAAVNGNVKGRDSGIVATPLKGLPLPLTATNPPGATNALAGRRLDRRPKVTASRRRGEIVQGLHQHDITIRDIGAGRDREASDDRDAHLPVVQAGQARRGARALPSATPPEDWRGEDARRDIRDMSARNGSPGLDARANRTVASRTTRRRCAQKPETPANTRYFEGVATRCTARRYSGLHFSCRRCGIGTSLVHKDLWPR